MEEFVNLNDEGEWLTFRIAAPGGTLPVKVSREAMDDHFGAGQEQGGMAQAFVRHQAAIEAKAMSKVQPGAVYTPGRPLELHTADF